MPPAVKKAAVSPKKIAAKKAEATKGPKTPVEHRGITFMIPHPLDMPLKVLKAKDEVEAMEIILDKKLWDAYIETGATFADLQELADKVAAAQGHGDAGN